MNIAHRLEKMHPTWMRDYVEIYASYIKCQCGREFVDDYEFESHACRFDALPSFRAVDRRYKTRPRRK